MKRYGSTESYLFSWPVIVNCLNIADYHQCKSSTFLGRVISDNIRI